MRSFNLKRNILTGILTVVPLWITWVVFRFVFNTLSEIGAPWVKTISIAIEDAVPSVAFWLGPSWIESTIAVIFTLIALYVLGWATTHVVGMKVIRAFDSLIERIPIVQTIYKSTKQLLEVLRNDPGHHIERVVLIDFPSDNLKAVGFVTTVMNDEATGEKLAAVYVPTTPNPTSGYLEIVPVERLVPTTWTIDEAMTFIVSGGAISPGRLTFRNHSTPTGGKET